MDGVTEQSNPTSTLLKRLWERNIPILLDRLNTLDNAAHAASSGTLTDTLRETALAQAHNLAGSLGMFGYPKGTDIAREIEGILYDSQLPTERLFPLTQALRATLFPTP